MRHSKGAERRAVKQAAFQKRGGYYYLNSQHQFKLLAAAFAPAMAAATGSKVLGAADDVQAQLRRAIASLNRRLARGFNEYNKYLGNGEQRHG